MSNYTKKAVKGVGFVFVLSILTAGFSYLIRLLYARNLTTEEYGLFYSILALMGLVSILKDLGLGKALVKFLPEFIVKNQNDKIRNSIFSVLIIQSIVWGIVILLLLFFSNFLAQNYFSNMQASLILNIVAIGFFIDSIAYIIAMSFQGFQMTSYTAGIDFTRMFFILSLSFILFGLGFGLKAAAFAYLLTPILLALIFVPLFLKLSKSYGKYKFDTGLVKKLFSYGFWLVALSAGAMILSYTDTLVLTYLLGLEKTGLYNVAIPTSKLLLFLPLAVGTVLFPMTAELWAKKKQNLIKEGAHLLYRYSLAFLIPMAGVVFCFSSLILSLFFGENYVGASGALKILSLSIIIFTVINVNAGILLGIGRAKVVTKIFLFAASFNLVFNFILIPKYGIIGAAFTTFISYLIMLFFTQLSVRKIAGVPLLLFSKSMVLIVIFILNVYILKNLFVFGGFIQLIVVSLSASGIHLILLFLLKLISLKELKMLKGRVFLK